MNESRKSIETRSYAGVQFWVFFLVAAALSTIYITQPVLPILQGEFGVNETRASLTISAVILGIALSNLPLGSLADRFSIKPIILMGGSVVALGGIVCATTGDIWLLIATRFVQGLFIPCLTTCLAAYLAKTLPLEKLNVAMGSYVSATVAGGLGGRLLGGFIHPPLHWRYAFVSTAVLLLAATLAACYFLPPDKRGPTADAESHGFLDLIARPDLLRIFSVAFSAFFVFSSIFNYLPFYLAAPPFSASTEIITLTYAAYLVGIPVGPLAGKLSNRIGNGATMALGAMVCGMSLGITLLTSFPAIAASLVLICTGFFSIHAAAAGSLNRRLVSGRGRANSLYVLSHYVGGFVGISMSGHMYVSFGWKGIVATGMIVLAVPLSNGLWELATERNHPRGPASPNNSR